MNSVRRNSSPSLTLGLVKEPENSMELKEIGKVKSEDGSQYEKVTNFMSAYQEFTQPLTSDYKLNVGVKSNLRQEIGSNPASLKDKFDLSKFMSNNIKPLGVNYFKDEVESIKIEEIQLPPNLAEVKTNPIGLSSEIKSGPVFQIFKSNSMEDINPTSRGFYSKVDEKLSETKLEEFKANFNDYVNVFCQPKDSGVMAVAATFSDKALNRINSTALDFLSMDTKNQIKLLSRIKEFLKQFSEAYSSFKRVLQDDYCFKVVQEKAKKATSPLMRKQIFKDYVSTVLQDTMKGFMDKYRGQFKDLAKLIGGHADNRAFTYSVESANNVLCRMVLFLYKISLSNKKVDVNVIPLSNSPKSDSKAGEVPQCAILNKRANLEWMSSYLPSLVEDYISQLEK